MRVPWLRQRCAGRERRPLLHLRWRPVAPVGTLHRALCHRHQRTSSCHTDAQHNCHIATNTMQRGRGVHSRSSGSRSSSSSSSDEDQAHPIDDSLRRAAAAAAAAGNGGTSSPESGEVRLPPPPPSVSNCNAASTAARSRRAAGASVKPGSCLSSPEGLAAEVGRAPGGRHAASSPSDLDLDDALVAAAAANDEPSGSDSREAGSDGEGDSDGGPGAGGAASAAVLQPPRVALPSGVVLIDSLQDRNVEVQRLLRAPRCAAWGVRGSCLAHCCFSRHPAPPPPPPPPCSHAHAFPAACRQHGTVLGCPQPPSCLPISSCAECGSAYAAIAGTLTKTTKRRGFAASSAAARATLRVTAPRRRATVPASSAHRQVRTSARQHAWCRWVQCRSPPALHKLLTRAPPPSPSSITHLSAVWA